MIKKKKRCRFTPVLLCNVLPNVTDTSHGAWRRLVSVQFPTLFKEQPDPKKPNERPVDFAIDGKIEAWADVFLTHMLTRGYEVAKETGLNVPPSVTLTTDDYRTESDFLPTTLRSAWCRPIARRTSWYGRTFGTTSTTGSARATAGSTSPKRSSAASGSRR